MEVTNLTTHGSTYIVYINNILCNVLRVSQFKRNLILAENSGKNKYKVIYHNYGDKKLLSYQYTMKNKK